MMNSHTPSDDALEISPRDWQELIEMANPAPGVRGCPFDGTGCINSNPCRRNIDAKSWRVFGCKKYQQAMRRARNALSED